MIYPESGQARRYRIVHPEVNVRDLIEEVNHRTVKLLNAASGAPLVDEYAVDMESALLNTCFEYAIASAGDELRSIMSGNEKPFIEEGNIIFPIKYTSLYDADDLNVLNTLLIELLAYRTLIGWYSGHDSEALIKKTVDLEHITLTEMRAVIRRLLQSLTRQPLRNPFSLNQ